MSPLSNAAVTTVADTAWLARRRERKCPYCQRSRCSSPTSTFGTAGGPGAGSPYFGEQLLIVDRGNNRHPPAQRHRPEVTGLSCPGQTASARPRRLLLPRLRLLHPPRHGDHLQPGGERDDRPDRLSDPARLLDVRTSRPSRVRSGLSQRARRATSARTATRPWRTPTTVGSSSSPRKQGAAPDRDDGLLHP